MPAGTALESEGAKTTGTTRNERGPHETGGRDHQAIPPRGGAAGAQLARRARHDGDGGQGLWPAEGPFRDLSRHRIRRALPAQAQDRDRGRRRASGRGDARHPRFGPDRPDRRRQDFRLRPRARHPHPHRRDRRGRPLTQAPLSGEISMTQRLTKKLVGIGALASLAALAFAVPALAQDATAAAPAAAAAAAPASPLNSGDTAWMMTSMALVLMMTIPGLGLFYGGMVRRKNVLATVMQSFAITCIV